MASTRHPHHFEDLSPDGFERLVYWLVRRSGEYDEVQWYGGARDKGRDVVAYRHTAQGREKCYIQCKRYQRIAFPDLRDELNKLAAHALDNPDFAPDAIVFATACPVPPGAKDRAEIHACDLGLPPPYYWGRVELDEKLKSQPDTQEEFFRARQRSALLSPFTLPAGLADFTGREAAIEQVRDQLDRQGAVAISGIHGMGGIGKTALAVHVAHKLIAEGRFPDAQLYIDLKGTEEPPVDPVEALESLLNTLVGPDPNRPRDLDTLSALWRQAIDGRDALLILDNAAGAAQVRPLLPGCVSCAVFVTSRQRFRLAGAGLLDLSKMDREEARKLLLSLAPHLDAGQVDAIADLCGHLPLALRVAGNYLGLNDDVTVETYARMLAEETRLVCLHDPDNPDLDVAAAISLSVNQLGAGPRQAWALLSLFPAPFDLSAAAALWDGTEKDRVLDGLQALRNRSLVSYERESRRYYQRGLIRLAAAKELEAAGEREVEAVRARLARHYEDVCRTADLLYKQGGEKVLQALALFDREWPHIQAGQAWAAVHTEWDQEAARLCSGYADAAAHFLSLRLHARDWIAWLDAATRAARHLGNRGAVATHLGHLGIAYHSLGEMEQAMAHHQEALQIARAIGDQRGEGKHLGNLGLAYVKLGQMEQAITHYESALEIARAIGDRRSEGTALGNLGNAYRSLGEMEQAMAHYTVALEIARAIGDRRGEGRHLGNLGNAYRKLGEMEQAIEHHTAALEIAREIGDRRGEGIRLGNLGVAYKNLGEMEQVIEHYTAALEIAREIGDRRNEANWLVNLGLLHHDRGNTARARDHWTRALVIYKAIQDPYAERVHGLLADLP